MAISKVVVVDGNNLIVRIDRGVAGRGVTDVEPVVIDGSLYLVFTFSDGTTETVGPVGTIQYVGVAPIVVNGSTISLSTVPVNLGGTGQVTANAGFNALAPSQATNAGKYLKTDGTNSAWDLLDISTADITGTLPIVNGGTGQTTANASFNALAPSQATNTGKYLKTDGTNTSWDLLDISTADITGTLAITNGGTGATTASGARTNLGLGTIATQDASAIAITGGTITGITDLAVADGGTGASTAAGARTNLNAADQATTLTAGTGLSGGGDLSANRTFSITNTGVTAASYGSASNTLTATVNAQGQLTSLAATPIAIANTQISGLGTISTQDANAVAITGGSITGITDLAVADGGTGASDAAGARTNLNAANQATTITAGTGLSGGGDLSANRTINIANTTVTAAAYGSASNTLSATVNAQGQLTALAATPIAISNTQVSGLGTMSTQNSNAVTITGGSITGITDLAIADGGTGASNAADARSNLGLGSAAVLNAGVALGVATLDAGGTVPLSQIPASIQGGVSYQGAWNASTNTPTLVSSVGSKGYYYVVSVAGNTNLNGVTDWLVGDWAIYNGTAWEKIDNTDQVASVNGYTGVVVLTNTDVGAPPTSLTISAGTGLSGGGSLAANRTLSIANTTVNAASYGTASAVPTFTVNGQGQLTAASDVTIAIANTQVSGLGTLSTQNANSVAITGGSITGITDLAVADGGTGASNATDARSNLSAAYNAITISAGTGLTGGGDLTANRTLAIDSSVVTLTGTQTLTNKTLTSPLVNEILDTNGNEILGLSPTASATDFVTIKNGIGVGVPLHVYADGPSTNIGLHIQPKGSGLVTISDGTDFNKGIRFRSSGSAASAVTLLDAVATAGRVVTLPDATTTLVGRDTTDTLTNKTIAFGSNTFSGSLPIANGGTGQTTANAAFNALAPSQTGNSGKYLTTDGTDTSWASNPLGTVTSVAASVPSFLSIAGSPITTSGTLAISLSGTALPTTSGGTGLTSFTSGGVVYASSGSALATGSALTFDGTFLTASRGITVNSSGIATSGFYNGVNVSGFDALGWSGSSTLALGGYRASQWTQLDFYTGGSIGLTLTNSSLYTASGINVGFGTNSTSSARLSVIGSDNATQAIFSGSIGGTGRGLRIATSLIASNNEGAILDAQATTGDATLILQTASTERGRFNSTGLAVTGTVSGTDYIAATKQQAGFSANSHFWAKGADATGNYAGTLYQMGTGSSLGKNWNGVVQTGAYGLSDFVWLANTTANATNVTSSDEKMRLTNAGRFLVGTTNGYGQVTANNQFQVYNPSADGLTNTVIGSITSQTRSYGTNIATSSFASIKFCTDPTVYYYGDIRFFTNNADATDTGGYERVRITSTGLTLFNGVTSANASSYIQAFSTSGNGNNAYIGVYTGGSGATSANHNLGIQFGTTSNSIRTTYNGSGVARNDLVFQTNGGDIAGFSNGYFGVGTTAPQVPVDVYRGSSGVVLNLEGVNAYNAETGITLSVGRAKISGFLESGGGTPGSILRFYTMPNGGSVTERLQISSNGDVNIYNGNAYNCYNFNNARFGSFYTNVNGTVVSSWNGSGEPLFLISPTGYITFNTNNAEKARIDTSGNFLIGTTTSPSGSNGLVIADNNSFQIGTYGGVNSIRYSTPGSIVGMYFKTAGSDKMILSDNGNLLLGVASNPNTARAYFRYDGMTTQIIVNSATTTSASTSWTHFAGQSGDGSSITTNNIFIYGNGNIQNANNSYGSLSDIKLKENIVDATPKLDKLMQVRIRNYNLKGDYEKHKQLGVVAQELETVFPAMIEETTDKDMDGNNLGTTTKSVKYSVFVPMLIKAMQEQQAIIESLKARLDAANL
jgi:hypothetical protein